MATRIGGFRRKSRHKLAKPQADKGKLSITRFFQKFEIGEKVCLKAEPAHQHGMYFPRFHGKVGVLTGKKGRCYAVKIRDMGKDKTVMVHPVHLTRVKNVNKA